MIGVFIAVTPESDEIYRRSTPDGHPTNEDAARAALEE